MGQFGLAIRINIVRKGGSISYAFYRTNPRVSSADTKQKVSLNDEVPTKYMVLQTCEGKRVLCEFCTINTSSYRIKKDFGIDLGQAPRVTVPTITH